MDRERFRRRQLPHWDIPGAPYFVTTCLDGSIPASGLLELAKDREEQRRRPRPEHLSPTEWAATCWKRTFVKLDDWLDVRPAVRHLERPDLAEVVMNAFLHFAGERYTLLAFVVMPSHIHWLFEPLPEWLESLPARESRSPREQITYSLHRFTATACNRLLSQRGPFWQHESYDHWVRDLDELERIIGYIEANPVKAGLAETPEQWPFSSASHRKRTGTERGLPLIRG